MVILSKVIMKRHSHREVVDVRVMEQLLPIKRL